MRDPAWYTDIRDAVHDNAARIDSGVASQTALTALARAEEHGTAGDKYPAMLDLDLIADAGDAQHRRRRRARRRAAPDQGRVRAAVEGDRRADVDERRRAPSAAPCRPRWR